ncbi:hypothetical protein NPIL_128281 [Nephila pilipes]|uniref:Uncharacterized protein n=1 Tax=Nephila pilipes TaxID=299642 RepID=A0A8X6QB30_NEPPI|nr:hypothetical protein NPIL_128281 [Nephila pilipes]
MAEVEPHRYLQFMTRVMGFTNSDSVKTLKTSFGPHYYSVEIPSLISKCNVRFKLWDSSSGIIKIIMTIYKILSAYQLPLYGKDYPLVFVMLQQELHVILVEEHWSAPFPICDVVPKIAIIDLIHPAGIQWVSQQANPISENPHQ